MSGDDAKHICLHLPVAEVLSVIVFLLGGAGRCYRTARWLGSGRGTRTACSQHMNSSVNDAMEYMRRELTER